MAVLREVHLYNPKINYRKKLVTNDYDAFGQQT